MFRNNIQKPSDVKMHFSLSCNFNEGKLRRERGRFFLMGSLLLFYWKNFKGFFSDLSRRNRQSNFPDISNKEPLIFLLKQIVGLLDGEHPHPSFGTPLVTTYHHVTIYYNTWIIFKISDQSHSLNYTSKQLFNFITAILSLNPFILAPSESA